MSDAWRPGLSQNIEEDEEIDDHLVPPTPGQEHIDAASPTQDNASALSCLTSTSTSSKRPLMFLGEPLSTLDDELMPYLGADVSETSSKVGLIEDCPGDDLESGFEKALSNAAASGVGVNTTQWGTPPTSPLASATASSTITSIASQTVTVEGTSLIATKSSLSSSEEHGHGQLEKKENSRKGKSNGSQSQGLSDEEEDMIPPSPSSREILATPTDGIPFLGSTSSSKRKHEAQGELYSCSPSKQPKIDNNSTDSGEERVIVNYDKLTKKDVEISPKHQAVTPHTKPEFPSSISKRINFSSEDSSDKDYKDPPNRLPYETELDDSDCEIIDDRNKSIEVVFQKPKIPSKSSISRSSLEVSDSQELDLQLTGLTQPEESQMSQMIDTEGGQRLSQAVLPYGLTEEPDNQSEELSQSQSQSLLPMPDSVHLSCHDTLSSNIEESTQSQGVGSMQVTQMESICQPAEFTQPPDIDTLLSYPIQKKDSGLTRKSKDNVGKEQSTISNGKESEESTKNIELLRKNSEVIVSQGCSTSKTIEDTPRLKLPEISTPSSQETPNNLESDGSESVFKKVSKAVEKKLLTDKNNEQSNMLFESSYEKVSYLEDQHGSCNNSSLIEISSAGSSTVTSPVKVSQSSHSTPISSQAEQRILHTSNLFASGKKDTSFGDKSQQILVEESDSDEGGVKNQSKNKKARSKLKEKVKNQQLEKVRKSSTPNTSHGISPNISDENEHSYIQKDVSSGPETSKSHNNSTENLSGENSAADTQLLSDLTDMPCTEEELLNRGYKLLPPQNLFLKKFIKESDKSVIYIAEDEGLAMIFSKSEMKPKDIARIGSGSSSSRGRISDISYISRSSGYSGYLGDKSSSSDASRRISMFSNNSARLSISSVATISPPRPNEHQEQDANGTFAVPQARAVTGKVNKSPITDEVTVRDLPENSNKGKAVNVEMCSKACQFPLDIVGDIEGSGRGRGSRAARGRAVRGSKTRGKPKGRGQGAILQDKDEKKYDSSTDSQDIASLPKTPIRKKSPLKRNNKDMTKSPKKLKKFNENVSSSEDLESILERCYTEMPLSEEEESAFMLEEGNDAEIQLDIIQDKVRHANLEINMLVFARFTDNIYYSARLIKEDAVHNRWDVEYTLDRYSHSVRDVHILPTVLLPRGQKCTVRPDNQLESMNDTGTVMGHLWDGKILKHIISIDRGMTLHTPHSHLVLTGEQIKRLLEARLKYRSMVASPGSDVNFDNICPGKRRRAPLVPYSSPGSKKEDPNLDTSDATAGESEDLVATHRKSPGRPRGRGHGRGNKRKNLFTLTEESEGEAEVTSAPSTSRGRGRGRPPPSPRTPQRSSHKGKATPEVISDVKKISDSPLPSRILEIQHEELPLKSPSPKKRGRSQSASKKIVIEESESLPVPLASSIGPLPQKDNIFAGFTVLITNGDSSLRKQENLEEDLPELNKEHLSKQVCQGGGKMVETFNEVEILLAEEIKSQAKATPSKSRKALKQKASNKILLISNTFCRTAKYISCLAAGIPCVDFRWIIQCCTQNKYVDWTSYSLLAGKTDNGEFEQKLNRENPVPSKVLLGTHVFLASSSINSEFKALWHPILVTAHAEVRDKPKNAKLLNRVLDRSVSVVLADSSISDEEAIRARQLNIPIVSTHWLIDSIISGQHLDYSHSEKFSHDYITPKPETVQDD